MKMESSFGSRRTSAALGWRGRAPKRHRSVAAAEVGEIGAPPDRRAVRASRKGRGGRRYKGHRAQQSRSANSSATARRPAPVVAAAAEAVLRHAADESAAVVRGVPPSAAPGASVRLDRSTGRPRALRWAGRRPTASAGPHPSRLLRSSSHACGAPTRPHQLSSAVCFQRARFMRTVNRSCIASTLPLPIGRRWRRVPA